MIERPVRRFNKGRMIGKPQIIVRAHIDNVLACAARLNTNVRLLGRNDNALALEQPLFLKRLGLIGKILQHIRNHKNALLKIKSFLVLFSKKELLPSYSQDKANASKGSTMFSSLQAANEANRCNKARRRAGASG
jgi:hypothetical protein